MQQGAPLCDGALHAARPPGACRAEHWHHQSCWLLPAAVMSVPTWHVPCWRVQTRQHDCSTCPSSHPPSPNPLAQTLTQDLTQIPHPNPTPRPSHKFPFRALP
eukprot:364976-Chlamydomonas_euryale.AAC.12